ncbi:MAG: hypothetical protein WA668_07865 [Candidatus Cybelea sp.]|jgi:hypothetical protein
MTDDEARLLTVTFGEGWAERTEMGLPLIDLSELTLGSGERIRAVFVRGQMNGYPTRLFFERPLTPISNLPMHTHPFLGKVMYAHSIKDIAATIPPHEAILAHLRLYKECG